MIGGIRYSLPADTGPTAKSLLKGILSKGAYLSTLVFSLLRHTWPYVHRVGARSYTSFFVCICLAVFIVLCGWSLFFPPPQPISGLMLLSPLAITKRVVISLEITSLFNFRVKYWLQMLWFGNLVWASPLSKTTLGLRIFISLIWLLLLYWYGKEILSCYINMKVKSCYCLLPSNEKWLWIEHMRYPLNLFIKQNITD